MAYQQNVELDANLIRLCMAGMQLQAGIRYNLKPDELQARADWLREQPREYRDKVIDRVLEIVKKGLEGIMP